MPAPVGVRGDGGPVRGEASLASGTAQWCPRTTWLRPGAGPFHRSSVPGTLLSE